MSVISMKAEAIAQTAIVANGNAVVDPTVIINAVTNIIGAIVSIYKSCQKTPAQAAEHMKATASGGVWGWLNRRRLWREVNNYYIPASVDKAHVYYALLASVKTITDSEVAAMYRGD